MKSWKRMISRCMAAALLATTLLPFAPQGSESTVASAAGSANIVKTIGGSDFMAVLKDDGTVWTWGNTGYVTGYYEHSSPTLRRGLPFIKDIAASQDFVLALDSNGNVWAWGQGYLGNVEYSSSTEPIQVLSGVEKIVAGGYHALALRTDKTVYAWGINYDGQLGIGTSGEGASTGVPTQVKTSTDTLTDVADIAAGNSSSYAVTVTGVVYSWGNNVIGQLGLGNVGGNSSVAIPVTGVGTVPGAKLYSNWISDHAFATVGESVYGWGSQSYLSSSPGVVSGLPSVENIATGYDFSLFLDTLGDVWGIGENWNDELTDLGGLTTTNTPVSLPLSNVKSLGAGMENSFAVTNDGLLYAWGYGYRGSMTQTLSEPTLTSIEETGKKFHVKVIDGITNASLIGDTLIMTLQDSERYGSASPTWDSVDGQYSFYNIDNVEHYLEVDYYDPVTYTYYKAYYEILPDMADGSTLTVTLYPKWFPEEIELIDEDARVGFIKGYLNSDATSSAEDTEFLLYFVDASGNPIGSALATSVNYPEMYVPVTQIPDNAAGLRMYVDTPLVSELITVDKWLLLTDDPVHIPSVIFEDKDPLQYDITPYVRWSDPIHTGNYTAYELYLIDDDDYYYGEVTVASYSEFGQRELLDTFPIADGTINQYTYDGDLNDDGIVDKNFYTGQKFGIRFVDASGNYSEMFYAPVHDTIIGENNTLYYEKEWVEETVEDVMFVDQDSDSGEIGGRVSWRPNGNIYEYVVYFVNDEGQIVKPYAHISGSEPFYLDIPMNTALPTYESKTATTIAVFPLEYGSDIPLQGTMPSAPSAPDIIEFADIDGKSNSIAGQVFFHALSKATGISRQEVYFTDGAGNVRGNGAIASATPNNYKEYHAAYNIVIGSADGTTSVPIPAGATHLGVRSVAVDGTPGAFYEQRLWDDRFFPSDFVFYDGNPASGVIEPVISWQKAPDETGPDGIGLTYRVSKEYDSATGSSWTNVKAGGAATDGSYTLTPSWTDYDTFTGYLQLEVLDSGGYPDNVSFIANIIDDASAETVLPAVAVNDSVPVVDYLFYYNKDESAEGAGGDIVWYDTSYYDPNYGSGDKYYVYLLNAQQERIKWIGTVHRVGNEHTYSIQDGTVFPVEAAYIGVSKVNANNEANSTLAMVPLQSNEIQHAVFVDTDLGSGEVRGSIRWNPPSDEVLITSYEVAFSDASGHSIQTIRTVSSGATEYAVELTADTTIPALSGYIAIAAIAADTSVLSKTVIAITDATDTPEGSAQYRYMVKSQIAELFNTDTDTKISMGKLIKYIRETEEDINGDGLINKDDAAFLLQLVEPRVLASE
jgi:alpha-tubulin suppressor-like RCC1 family protein